MIDENSVVAAITKQGSASFLICGGVLIQLEVFVSNSPSFCNSRYCSSVKISMPIAAAISSALFAGLLLLSRSSASPS